MVAARSLSSRSTAQTRGFQLIRCIIDLSEEDITGLEAIDKMHTTFAFAIIPRLAGALSLRLLMSVYEMLAIIAQLGTRI